MLQILVSNDLPRYDPDGIRYVYLHPVQPFRAQLLAIVLNLWLGPVRMIESVIRISTDLDRTRVHENLNLELEREVGYQLQHDGSTFSLQVSGQQAEGWISYLGLLDLPVCALAEAGIRKRDEDTPYSTAI